MEVEHGTMTLTGMQPLVHWSGKGMGASELEDSIERMQAHGLRNVLFVTGDKLRSPSRCQRDRYLESVNAVYIAKRKMKELTASVALNPFKYREAEAMAQYLKFSKKVAVGAEAANDRVMRRLALQVQELFYSGFTCVRRRARRALRTARAAARILTGANSAIGSAFTAAGTGWPGTTTSLRK